MSDAPQLEPDPTQQVSPPADDRLNELERQVLAQFEAEAVEALPEDVPADDGGSPPDSTGDGPEGGGMVAPTAAPDPLAATSTADPAADPAADPEIDFAQGDGEGQESDFSAPVTEWAEEDQARARQLVDWSSSLTPETIAQIDAVTSGNYALVPLEDVPAISAFYKAREEGQTAQATPPATTPPPAWEDDPDLPTDPRLDQLQARLDAQEAALQAQTQTASLEAARTEINTGAEEWFAANPSLSLEDRGRLEHWIIESGAYLQHASRYKPRQAIQQALNQGLALDPVISQRRIDAQVAERVAQERETLAAQARQNAGSSTLAGSGSVMAPGRGPVDPDAAMVEMIRQNMQT